MRMLVSALFFSSIVACRTGPSISPPPTDLVAFVGGTVHTFEAPPAFRTIIVRGSQIEAIGAPQELATPAGAQIIDATGLHLMPGLADMHVHLEMEPENWIPLFLTCGVTTVMNLHGRPANVSLREKVRTGSVLGPRIFTAGRYANKPLIETVDDAVKFVGAEKDAGYDVIKIHGDLTRDAYLQLVDEGRRAGIAVIGHAPRNLPIEAVFEARQASLVHAEEVVYAAFPEAASRTREAVATLAARVKQNGLSVIPTMGIQRSLSEQWGRPGQIESITATLPGGDALTTDLRMMWLSLDPYGHRPAESARKSMPSTRSCERLWENSTKRAFTWCSVPTHPCRGWFPDFRSLRKSIT